MAGYSRSAALRKALGLEAQTPTSSRPLYADPFTERDWQQAAGWREAMDSIQYNAPVRWHVGVSIPGDPETRHFFLRGSHAQVTVRAANLFPPPFLVLVEPAPLQHVPEVIDRRLTSNFRSEEP